MYVCAQVCEWPWVDELMVGRVCVSVVVVGQRWSEVIFEKGLGATNFASFGTKQVTNRQSCADLAIVNQ